MGIFAGDRTYLGSDYDTFDEAYNAEYGPSNLVLEAYQNEAVIFENLVKFDFLEAGGYLNESILDSARGVIDKIWTAILKVVNNIRDKVNSFVDSALDKFRNFCKERYEKDVKKYTDDYKKNASRLEKVRKPSLCFTRNGNIGTKINENLGNFKSTLEKYASVDRVKSMSIDDIDKAMNGKLSEKLYAEILGESGNSISSGKFKTVFSSKYVEKFNVDYPFANGGHAAILSVVTGKTDALNSLRDFKKKVNEYCKTQETEAKNMKKKAKDMESGNEKDIEVKRAKYAQACVNAAQKVVGTLFSTYYGEMKKFFSAAFSLFKYGATYKKGGSNEEAKKESEIAEFEYRAAMLESMIELESPQYTGDEYYEESYNDYYNDNNYYEESYNDDYYEESYNDDYYYDESYSDNEFIW